MTGDSLTLRALKVRAVDVPMARPLVTSGGSVASAPLILIDLETEEGVTGCCYVFAYTPRVLPALVALIEAVGETLAGDPIAPLAIEAKLQGQFRLLGAQGLAGMALSGIDMAAWDALAKARDLPLVRALGAEPVAVPAYNSAGLGIIGPDKAGPEAAELLEPGFRAVKVRLGYAAGVKADVAVVRAVREAVGEDVPLMSDFNQALSVPEAEQRIRVLDEEELYWFEEPVRFDDYAGHARIRAEARTPIQTGENCWGPHDIEKAFSAGASDYFMPDAGKCGGVTGWQRAVALAEPLGIPISCHLYPEVSVHLLAATPTRHWLEWVDWANPILQEPLKIEDGAATAPERPGIGIAWDEAAVARFSL